MELFLFPVMPDVLDVIILGRFMCKELSKISLKISGFQCLRRPKVAILLVRYVTILLDRLSITDAVANVNSHCGGVFSLFISKYKIPPLIILSISIHIACNMRVCHHAKSKHNIQLSLCVTALSSLHTSQLAAIAA